MGPVDVPPALCAMIAPCQSRNALAIPLNWARMTQPAPLLFLRHIKVRQRPRESFRGEGESLRQGRMRMDGQADVFGFRAHFDRQRGFGDEVAGVGADDAAADEAAGLFVPKRLGLAFVAAERQRTSAGRPRKYGFAEFCA